MSVRVDRLPVILALFAALAVAYMAVIPPFEGPDEPQHWAYVAWLAEGKGFPPGGDAAWQTAIQQEASQPPLYYLLASVPARFIGTGDPAPVFHLNPHFFPTAPRTAPDNKNMALPIADRSLQGGWLSLYLARGVSLLAGLILVGATYALAREVLGNTGWAAPGAALLVALTPQVLFMSSVITNDVAAAAASAVALWLIVRLLRRGYSRPRALATGLALGVALLTKTSTVTLWLPLALGLAWMPITGRWRWHQAVSAAIWIALPAALVSGWWYLRLWRLNGPSLGLQLHCRAPWAYCGRPEARWQPPLAEWGEVFESYWAVFGWGTIKLPIWTYILLALLVLLAIASLIKRFLPTGDRNPLSVIHNPKQPSRLTAYGLRLTDHQILLILLTITVLLQALALELWMRQIHAPHGRLLMPVASAIAVLLVAGWSAWSRRLIPIAILPLAAISLLSPALLLRPAYALPQPLALDQPAAANEALGWRFGDLAELQSLTLEQQSVEAGGWLPVRLCWRTLARADRNYTVLVHLVGPGDRVVARRHTYPGVGTYPTTIWQPGQRFCDQLFIPIPQDLAQTLVYRVEVGWLDDATDERLPAYGPDGNPLDHTFVDAVRLEAADTVEASAPPGSGPIRLVDFTVPPVAQPGEAPPLTLHWWSDGTPDADYQLFVHLRQPATGELAAQADGPPLQGWYPTSWWEANELVVDERTFPLPADIAPGSYDLVVGWYDLATGERIGEEYRLTTVTVTG